MNERAPAVRGLYAITPDEPDTALLARKVAAAVAGGASIVQYRNKLTAGPARREQAEALLAICRPAGVPLIINDDLELAVAVGADGLHLGRTDGDLREARRRIGVRMRLGASCYNDLALAEAAIAAGADHIAFGSAFASSTKPGAIRATLDLYAAARRRFDLPIVAIGGITFDNAAALIATGVDAIAVITALFDHSSEDAIANAARRFAALFTAAQERSQQR